MIGEVLRWDLLVPSLVGTLLVASILALHRLTTTVARLSQEVHDLRHATDALASRLARLETRAMTPPRPA